MQKLEVTALLADKHRRHAFLKECSSLIEERVRNQRGVRGLAVKNAFRLLNKFLPNASYKATDFLLEDFMSQIKPHLLEYSLSENRINLSEHLTVQSKEVAACLLLATDKHALVHPSRAMVKLYQTLRPKAKQEVQEALPELALIIEKHLVTPTGIEPMSAT